LTEPPIGTITLLFSDIEGSTRLLHERGDEYADLLAHHRKVVRAALAQHLGREVDTQGDAFFAVFSSAAGAVTAALAIQADHAAGPIRVRMGIHTGAPLWTGEGYVGPDVHLAARVCSAAHGGQVLLSGATRQFVEDLAATDLGLYRLKDIAEPVQLYQVGEGTFPPLRTLHATNLPVQPTGLIGRERELAALADLLRDDGPRLITLLGPGGIGKTSLALAAAAERVPVTPAGVFFVDLTRVREPGQVGLAIAQTIGAVGDLEAHIGQKATLLVLDNMEHVIDARADVAQLLTHCANLRFLVTSRTRLNLRGEHGYAIDPLPEDASVALFIERGRAVDPGITADASVVEICRRLDGLPLAIELAASRLGVLSTTALLQRLGDRLTLLTGGSRDLPDRQQTLRATVAWSVDLLPSEPRALFSRLAVFVGGWTLDAAELICHASLDDLAVLVESSLVQRTANRYGMLETIREFAADEMAATPDADALHERHARFYFEQCRTALTRGSTSAMVDHDESLDLFRRDYPNFSATLAWLHAHVAAEDLSVMVVALWFYWLTTGASEEGERWIQAALDLTDPADSVDRAWLFAILGEFPRFNGDYRRAVAIKLDSLAMARRVGDHGMAAAVLADLTSLLAAIGEFEAAKRYGEEALQLRRMYALQLGVAGGRWVAHALHGLAELAMKSGDPVEAERLLREADELDASAGSPPRDRVWTMFLLEEAIRGQGRLDEAYGLARDVLAWAFELDFPMMVMESLVALAEIRSHDDLNAAATVLGAVDALRERVHLTPFDPDDHRRTIARTREALGDNAYETASQRGRQLTPDELLALA
jgi:predicted ATPase/class 3 adenylate cyclase